MAKVQNPYLALRKCSHKSKYIKELIKQGIQVSEFFRRNPDFGKEKVGDLGLLVPSSQITALCEKFEIPFLLAKQIVNNPDPGPFYLIIPKEHLHFHLKKSNLDEDSYVRIPWLKLKLYYPFDAKVRSVESARANHDTLFMDVLEEPDLRVNRSWEKPGKPRSLLYNESVRFPLDQKAKRRDKKLPRSRDIGQPKL